MTEQETIEKIAKARKLEPFVLPNGARREQRLTAEIIHSPGKPFIAGSIVNMNFLGNAADTAYKLSITVPMTDTWVIEKDPLNSLKFSDPNRDRTINNIATSQEFGIRQNTLVLPAPEKIARLSDKQSRLDTIQRLSKYTIAFLPQDGTSAVVISGPENDIPYYQAIISEATARRIQIYRVNETPYSELTPKQLFSSVWIRSMLERSVGPILATEESLWKISEFYKQIEILKQSQYNQQVLAARFLEVENILQSLREGAIQDKAESNGKIAALEKILSEKETLSNPEYFDSWGILYGTIEIEYALRIFQVAFLHLERLAAISAHKNRVLIVGRTTAELDRNILSPKITVVGNTLSEIALYLTWGFADKESLADVEEIQNAIARLAINPIFNPDYLG